MKISWRNEGKEERIFKGISKKELDKSHKKEVAPCDRPRLP